MVAHNLVPRPPSRKKHIVCVDLRGGVGCICCCIVVSAAVVLLLLLLLLLLSSFSRFIRIKYQWCVEITLCCCVISHML